MKILLLHLLKFQFQPVHLMAYADEAYRSAARAAALETGLPLATFPLSNAHSQAELLDPDFVP